MFAELGEAEASAKFAPKLSQIFWATYDSSISAPNEPVEFSREALAAATMEAEKAAHVHASLIQNETAMSSLLFVGAAALQSGLRSLLTRYGMQPELRWGF